jgi:hypothetical protein
VRIDIGRLVRSHRNATSGGSLPDNLGDGFLLARNEVFRNVRMGALESGFRFSAASYPAHRAFPLSTLDDFLGRKVIPYVDNVSVLEDLARRSKMVFLETDFEMLAKNYAFHEAAHACARTIHERNAATPTRRMRVLRMMVEEAFANTVEVFACHEMDSRLHAAFLAYNSYALPVVPACVRRARVKRAERAFRFGVVLLSYVHAHFLYRELGARELERSVRFVLRATGASLPGAEAARRALMQSLGRMFGIGLTLNPVARVLTTEFYCRLHRLGRDVARVVDFDFMEMLEHDEAMAASVAQMIALAVAPRSAGRVVASSNRVRARRVSHA